MPRRTGPITAQPTAREGALSWLSVREEEQLSAGKTTQELEAQALVRQAILRDPEPDLQLALLTTREEGRLQELGVASGFIPNTRTTFVRWRKEGSVLHYHESTKLADGKEESGEAASLRPEGDSPPQRTGGNPMTPEETQAFWRRHVALGRLMHDHTGPRLRRPKVRGPAQDRQRRHARRSRSVAGG